MEKLHFKTYSELCQFIDEVEGEIYIDKECYCVLDYYDFKVYRCNHQYFFKEIGVNDADRFCELELIAELEYSEEHDLRIKDAETLHSLFDCDVCGEQVTDDYIRYLWFKEVKNHD